MLWMSFGTAFTSTDSENRQGALKRLKDQERLMQLNTRLL
jgi:hypothetical protein